MVKHTIHTVAMFGGSFDPPHLGHRIIVEKALIELDIDLLIIMPAYQNPLKNRSIASHFDRLAMCKAVFGEIDNIIISDYEIKQEIRYTYESVKYFKNMYDLKYLIIGADNLETLHLWQQFEWINSNITWVIVTRNSINIDTVSTVKLKNYQIISLNENVSSSEIRLGLKQEMLHDKIIDKVKKIYKGNR